MRKRLIWPSLVISLALLFIGACHKNPCADLERTIKGLYDSTDDLQLKSLSFFSTDAELITWAEGLNGRHWDETHYHGPDEIRKALTNRGLRRISDKPDSPVFHETEFEISGNKVEFVLKPDRLGRDQRQHNPYIVTVIFEGCKIKQMTVIEFITWV